MKYLRNIFLATILLYMGVLNCEAQQVFKPLKIGDKVPEELWKSIPKKKNTELVILDFWATYCGSCISAFPKMVKLQSQFDGKLQVVLINTWETETEVETTFKKINSKRSKDKWIKTPASLAALNGASIFQELFPHLALPHHVWLNQEGKVIAITDGENANEQNVRNALNEKSISLEYKVDFFGNKPLYIGEEQSVDLNEFEQWSLFKKGKISDARKVNSTRQFYIKDSGSRSETRGYAMRDVTLKELFSTCQNRLFPYTELGEESRILFELNNMDRVEWKAEWDITKSKEEKQAWEKENLYTYDILLPLSEVKADKKQIYKQMLQDINRYSNYVGSFEKRKVKCLVLVRISKEDKIKTKGEKSDPEFDKNYTSLDIRNRPFSLLLKLLRSKLNQSLNIPVLDETKYTGNIDMALAKFENIKDLRGELKRYDLDLIEAEREIEMFVVKDKVLVK